MRWHLSFGEGECIHVLRRIELKLDALCKEVGVDMTKLGDAINQLVADDATLSQEVDQAISVMQNMSANTQIAVQKALQDAGVDSDTESTVLLAADNAVNMEMAKLQAALGASQVNQPVQPPVTDGVATGSAGFGSVASAPPCSGAAGTGVAGSPAGAVPPPPVSAAPVGDAPAPVATDAADPALNPEPVPPEAAAGNATGV